MRLRTKINKRIKQFSKTGMGCVSESKTRNYSQRLLVSILEENPLSWHLFTHKKKIGFLGSKQNKWFIWNHRDEKGKIKQFARIDGVYGHWIQIFRNTMHIQIKTSTTTKILIYLNINKRQWTTGKKTNFLKTN